MATFKETREILLASYASNIITIEEYALLFEENSSSNLDFTYYNYPRFNLESQSEAECRANFRVERRHIPLVEDVLQIPQYFVCDQGTVCEGTEGLCMILKRYSFPCRYADMISTRTLHDMQHRNRLDLCTSWSQNHAMEPNHFKSTRAGKVRGSCF